MAQGRRPPPTIRYYLDYDYKVNHRIIRTFALKMIDEITTNPEGCTLPLDLGMIKIVGNRKQSKEDPQANLAVNGTYKYKYSKDGEGKRTPFQNYHTDGKTFRPVWYSTVLGNTEDILKKAFKNSDIYVFKASHALKRALFNQITKHKMWPKYHMSTSIRSTSVHLGRGRGRPRKVKVAEGGTSPIQDNNDTTRSSIPA